MLPCASTSRTHAKAARLTALDAGQGIAAMGQRTSYALGTFSWTALVTSDAEAAKSFYAALIGVVVRRQPDLRRRGLLHGPPRDAKFVTDASRLALMSSEPTGGAGSL
jgi:hypothetical protein